MVIAEERYKRILDILQEKDYVSTTELIEALGTSRETVRRDLNTLAARGALIKTHGGASSKESITALYDAPIILREAACVSEKKILCKYAADFIEDKDNIFIDDSSTAAHLINYIPKSYHITLITYSIKLLLELARLKTTNWNIISLGGTFDFRTLSANGYLTTSNLSIFKPTKAFMSCHGIDKDFNVTDGYLYEVEIKRALLKNSQETFLLADHSKLPRSGVMRVEDSLAYDHIITNKCSEPAFTEALIKRGCNLSQC